MEERVLEMADGISLSVSIFSSGFGRLVLFKTADVDFLGDSVLYEVFFATGGEVIAYSPTRDGYKIKAFSPTLD